MSEFSEPDVLHSLEMEMAALGSMFASADAAKALKKILEPRDFWRSSHREIFSVITSLKSRPDRLIVLDKLRRSESLEKIGGEEYLDQIIAFMPFNHPYTPG